MQNFLSMETDPSPGTSGLDNQETCLQTDQLYNHTFGEKIVDCQQLTVIGLILHIAYPALAYKS